MLRPNDNGNKSLGIVVSTLAIIGVPLLQEWSPLYHKEQRLVKLQRLSDIENNQIVHCFQSHNDLLLILCLILALLGEILSSLSSIKD